MSEEKNDVPLDANEFARSLLKYFHYIAETGCTEVDDLLLVKNIMDRDWALRLEEAKWWKSNIEESWKHDDCNCIICGRVKMHALPRKEKRESEGSK